MLHISENPRISIIFSRNRWKDISVYLYQNKKGFVSTAGRGPSLVNLSGYFQEKLNNKTPKKSVHPRYNTGIEEFKTGIFFGTILYLFKE